MALANSPGLTLHHIGMIVRDLDEAVDRYRMLGFSEPEISEVADQNVRVATFRAGTGFIEVIAPVELDGGLARFLESRGEGMHHVAYAVPDISQALADLRDRGFELIDESPRRGAHDWLVAFIHPRSCHGVLTELVQIEQGASDASGER
jgi:methylmalonyl-CoA/ethylmalonyl-CoA epimerase